MTVPQPKWFSSIVWVVFENHGFNQAQRLTSHQALANQGSLLTNYHAITHPSGPNYRSLASGDPCVQTETFGQFKPNLASELAKIGVPTTTWHARGTIADRHNPFQDLVTTVSVVKGSLDMATLSPQSQLYVGYDDWNNAHSGLMSRADENLTFLVSVLNASAWFNTQVQGKYPALCVVWDEDLVDPAANKVWCSWYGKGVKTKYISTAAYNHYSFCKTVMMNWGLPPLNDQNTPVEITDIWL